MTPTPTIERVKARLSCNHTIEVPAGQPEGATVTCDKCPTGNAGQARTRRIKKLVCPVPAFGKVPDLTKGGPHRPDTKTDDLVTELETSVAVVQAAKASDDREERLRLSKEEWKAMKVWRNAPGVQGPRPATPNLDAINADYAAGTKSTKTKAKRDATPKNERRLAAIAAQQACNNKRGKGTPISDADLTVYIAKVRSDYPESTRTDELEYAYWAAKLAISRPRWYAAWDAADRAQSQPPVRIIDHTREEEEPCERLTLGCPIDHTAEGTDSECTTW